MNAYDQVPFTEEYKKALTSIRTISAVMYDIPYLMVRKNTKNEQVDKTLPQYSNYDDIDTFVINASSESENTIEYTSTADIVNLNIRDGGFF
jgi:hypothetical protein